MPDTPEQKPQPKPVSVRDSKGVIIGDFNQVVQNFLADPHLRYYLIGIAVLVIAAGTGLYFLLPGRIAPLVQLPTLTPPPPTSTPYMRSSFNVAVSRLVVNGPSGTEDMGRRIAELVHNQLAANLDELAASGLVPKDHDVWGPDEIEPVTGETAEQRSAEAARIARAHAVHVLVYGRIQAVSAAQYTITPEFYISDRDLRDVDELTGQNSLGSDFDLRGEPFSASFNTRLESALAPRVRLLTTVIRGLTLYVTHDYAAALGVFRQAAPLDAAGPPADGQEFLYLMAGNAAGKNRQYDLALQYYEKSFAVHPEQPYARALIGRAGVLFMQSVKPWQSTRVEDIDFDLLTQSTNLYEQALQAPNKPPNGDVDMKAAFGMGQNYFYRWFGHKEEFADPAVENFTKVIQAYNSGDEALKQRAWALAAYSHGYLGLIYELASVPDSAKAEYRQAVDLLQQNDLDEDGRNKLTFYRSHLEKLP